MQWYVFEPLPKNMNPMQWHIFKQPPIGKTQDKYCLLFFMHRNEIGFLTPFAKINKRGGLNKVRGKNLKINKRHPSCINLPRVVHLLLTLSK